MGNLIPKWMVGETVGVEEGVTAEVGEEVVMIGKKLVVASNDQVITQLQNKGVTNLQADQGKLTQLEELNYNEVITLRGQFL